jgi:hypothetical protein
LTADERRIVQFIASKPLYGADISTISRETGIPYEKVRRILNGRNDRNTKGLTEKVKGLTKDLINEEFNGTDRRTCVKYYLKSVNIWDLYDQEFIILKDE